LAQLRRATPLDGPSLHHSLLIRRLNVNKGMRVPEHELHELSLKLDLFADIVGRAVRVMRIGCGAGEQRSREHEKNDFTHLYFSPSAGYLPGPPKA
jgi:hypothetical protein